MTFQQWLHGQRHRDDAVGDLARDAHADRDTPTGQTTSRTWLRYLRRRGACDGALEALRQAWAEYRAMGHHGGC
jgi:hypothetical protein